MLRIVMTILFLVFGNVVRHCLLCLIYYIQIICGDTFACALGVCVNSFHCCSISIIMMEIIYNIVLLNLLLLVCILKQPMGSSIYTVTLDNETHLFNLLLLM